MGRYLIIDKETRLVEAAFRNQDDALECLDRWNEDLDRDGEYDLGYQNLELGKEL